MTETGGEPPADAIEIGPRNRIEFCEYQGETAGIMEWHLKPDGKWCCGWIAFDGAAWARQFNGKITVWQVIKRDPLTLTPSIRCRACGTHGHITGGRWVPA
jgi:hypothetical protein